jgi:hypothetical protein
MSCFKDYTTGIQNNGWMKWCLICFASFVVSVRESKLSENSSPIVRQTLCRLVGISGRWSRTSTAVSTHLYACSILSNAQCKAFVKFPGPIALRR